MIKWEKIFATNMPDKILKSRMYKVLQVSKTNNQTKLGKRHEQTLHKRKMSGT